MGGITVRVCVAAGLLLMTSACSGLETQAKSEPPAMHQLFLFQYTPGPTWRADVPMAKQGLGPHAAYMGQLFEQGRLFAGGGYTNVDGGMAIVIASDIDEARAMLAADPAVVDGIFAAELRQWMPRFRAEGPLPVSD